MSLPPHAKLDEFAAHLILRISKDMRCPYAAIQLEHDILLHCTAGGADKVYYMAMATVQMVTPKRFVCARLWGRNSQSIDTLPNKTIPHATVMQMVQDWDTTKATRISHYYQVIQERTTINQQERETMAQRAPQIPEEAATSFTDFLNEADAFAKGETDVTPSRTRTVARSCRKASR